MFNEEKLTEIRNLCLGHSAIKLLYLFGSQSSGTAGPLSDYDFAIYIDKNESTDSFLLPEISAQLSRVIGSDKVDICDLAELDAPELAFEIIQGKLLYEIEPYKVIVEPHIMNMYFDFKIGLRNNFLTRD